MKKYDDFKFTYILLCLFAAFALLITGCGGKKDGDLPINKIKKAVTDVPTYSIILEDMKEDGNFFKTYYHKYRVVQETEGWTTDWLEVPENYYNTNENFLGMSLAARKEGKDNSTVSPPGYNYVGDDRYGKWGTDHRGNSFWEWYGKYALFSSMFGGWYRPVYMNDYNTYSRYRSQNRPFYGRNKEFGSSGSIAKKTKPNFYSRHMSKQRSRSSSFSSKVSKRVGRTKTGFRSRSGGFGK
jgi:hypothetical protein